MLHSLFRLHCCLMREVTHVLYWEFNFLFILSMSTRSDILLCSTLKSTSLQRRGLLTRSGRSTWRFCLTSVVWLRCTAPQSTRYETKLRTISSSRGHQ